MPSPFGGANEEQLGSVQSEEMYDRLEEIYGLGKFNFGGEGVIYKSIGVADSDASNDDGGEKEEDGGSGASLFDHILSGVGTGSSQSNSALHMLLPSPSAPICGIEHHAKQLKF